MKAGVSTTFASRRTQTGGGLQPARVFSPAAGVSTFLSHVGPALLGCRRPFGRRRPGLYRAEQRSDTTVHPARALFTIAPGGGLPCRTPPERAAAAQKGWPHKESQAEM